MEEPIFKSSKNFEGLIFKKALMVSEQILFYFIDFIRAANPQVIKTWKYEIPIREYDRFREQNKIKFCREMYRLKHAGIIREYLNIKNVLLNSPRKERNASKNMSYQLWRLNCRPNGIGNGDW